MKRLRKIIFNALALLSLLLFVATVALWVRSYFANDWIGWIHFTPGIENEDHHLWLESNCGILELAGGGDPIENFSQAHWQRRHLPIDKRRTLYGTDGPPYLRAIGISWQRPRRLITGEISWTVSVRVWLLAVLSGLSTIFLFTPWQKLLARTEAGTCLHCGYDLRATPDRCPECGNVPAKVEA